MDPSSRRELEKQELLALHEYFEQGRVCEQDVDEYPPLPSQIESDLWTDALSSVIEQNQDDLKIIHGRIRLSDMAPEALRWWNKILAVAEKAPVREFESLLKGHRDMPATLNKECFEVAGDIIAEWGMNTEIQKRQKAEEAEHRKLKELEKNVSHARDKLDEANNDLKRHRGEIN